MRVPVLGVCVSVEGGGQGWHWGRLGGRTKEFQQLLELVFFAKVKAFSILRWNRFLLTDAGACAGRGWCVCMVGGESPCVTTHSDAVNLCTFANVWSCVSVYKLI